MRAKTVISHKALPQHTEVRWGEGDRTLSTLSLSYKAVYQGGGGSFGNCRLSSYQVISKEKLVNTLNIIKGELYQTVPGI